MPDLAAVKQRQQQAWASGDFAVVAARIVIVAEQLVDNADLQAGWRVLDVATGSGNARHRCGAARLRGRGHRLRAGAARARPRAGCRRGPRASSSSRETRGVALRRRRVRRRDLGLRRDVRPDHARAAAELLRVTRPGGTIALASWTPDGFIGHLFRTVAGHVPPPAGVASPMLWGTEAHLRDLFGEGIARSRSRSAPSRGASRRRRRSWTSSGAGTARR